MTMTERPESEAERAGRRRLLSLDVLWELRALDLLERPDPARTVQVGTNVLVVSDRDGDVVHLADCGPADSQQSWPVAALLVRLINAAPELLDAPGGETVKAVLR